MQSKSSFSQLWETDNVLEGGAVHPCDWILTVLPPEPHLPLECV